ncbi:DNA polymerase III subunit delta [Bacillus alkalicellulosilyticus]|uniref:DNA polymerase III subunit delta n=1 Tax=Alkalihalobacterium alkalicellulosilyticum TaxID=1912214 RepID=UPI0009962C6D|nr:DNA polymerase III subunit delta [Bacillus alkalicellulosilyticus]
MSYIQMKQKIEKNQIAPLYLLIGLEAYLVDDIIHAVIEKTLQPEEREFNLSTYEMKETMIDVAVEDAQTLPFLGSKRVVLVKDAYFLTAQRIDSKLDHNVTRLEEYIENPMPETVFIITAPYEKLDERKKITKKLRSQAEVLEAKEFDQKMINEWVDDQARQHQIAVDHDAKELLMQLLGGNLLMMSNELKKLSLYVGSDGTVTKQIVQQMVARTLEQDIFALIDHVIHSRIDKALDLFFELLRQKEDPIKIIALLARQFRIVYMVKELVKQGYAQKQIASQIKIHPYAVKLATQQAKGFEDKRLFFCLEELATMDYKIKTGQIDKKLAVELFLMKLT